MGGSTRSPWRTCSATRGKRRPSTEVLTRRWEHHSRKCSNNSLIHHYSHAGDWILTFVFFFFSYLLTFFRALNVTDSPFRISYSSDFLHFTHLTTLTECFVSLSEFYFCINILCHVFCILFVSFSFLTSKLHVFLN